VGVGSGAFYDFSNIADLRAVASDRRKINRCRAGTLSDGAVMYLLVHYPGVCLEILRKITKINSGRITNVAAGIRNEVLPRYEFTVLRLNQSVRSDSLKYLTSHWRLYHVQVSLCWGMGGGGLYWSRVPIFVTGRSKER
jgi:hypothetical protein